SAAPQRRLIADLTSAGLRAPVESREHVLAQPGAMRLFPAAQERGHALARAPRDYAAVELRECCGDLRIVEATIGGRLSKRQVIVIEQLENAHHLVRNECVRVEIERALER